MASNPIGKGTAASSGAIGGVLERAPAGTSAAGMKDQAALEGGFADPPRDAQRCFRAVLAAFAEPGTIQPLGAVARPPSPLPAGLGAIALTLADHETPVWLAPAYCAAAGWLTFHTGAPVSTDRAAARFAFLDGFRLPAEYSADGDGPDRDGPDRNGPNRDGPDNCRAADDGATDENRADDGPADDDPADKGPAGDRDGPAKSGFADGFALGDDAYPDRSATLVVAVRFGPAPDGDAIGLVRFVLSGPGIADRREVMLDLPPAFAEAWAANRGLFPRGHDLLLVDGDRVMGLPRTTEITCTSR